MRRSAHKPIFRQRKTMGTIAPANSTYSAPPTPPQLQVVGTITDALLGGARHMAAFGAYLFVGARNVTRFVVIDVTDPTTPVIAGSVTDALLGNIDGITIDPSGDYAYVSRGNGDRVIVVDISTPATPTIVGSVTDGVNLNGVNGIDFFAPDHVVLAVFDGDGIATVDISVPASPALEGQLIGQTQADGAEDVVVDGNNAIVCAYNANRVTVFDITNPAAPTLTGSVQSALQLLEANTLIVTDPGNTVHVHGFERVTAVDISTPATPALIGSLISSTLDLSDQMALYVGYLAVAGNGSDTVALLDISGATPVVAHELTDAVDLSGPSACCTVNSVVAVACPGVDRVTFLSLYEIENPGGPSGPTDPEAPVDPSDPPPEVPASGTIDMVDFTELNDTVGKYFTGDLAGDGMLSTSYVLTASTKAGSVPTAQGSINLYRGQFAGKTGTPYQPTIEISDYTIDMSDVNHNVGGIQIGYVADVHVHDFRVIGCKGSTSSPPGETMSLSLWHCLQSLVEDVIIDGRNLAGTPIAATLFAVNTSKDTTVQNCAFNYAKYGFGIANWKGTGVNVFDNIDLRWNRRAVNHEQCLGSWTYLGPDCRNSIGPGGTGYRHFVMNGTLGSAELIIDEPIWDRTVNGANNPFRVGVYTGAYYDVGNGYITQLASDVHVRIDGVWYDGPINNSLLSIGPY